MTKKNNKMHQKKIKIKTKLHHQTHSDSGGARNFIEFGQNFDRKFRKFIKWHLPPDFI